MTSEALKAGWAIAALEHHLKYGSWIAEENRAILLEAIAPCVESGFAASIDEALAIRSRGGATVAESYARWQRDLILYGIWKSSSEWRDMSSAVAAKMMVLSARRYERGRWTRDRQSLACPLNDPDASWWQILRQGQKIPGVKRLGQVLSEQDAPFK